MPEGSGEAWPYGPVKFSREHPVNGHDRYASKVDDPEPVNDLTETHVLTTADLMRLAGSGDQMLIQGRKQPLEVVGRETSGEGRMNSGYSERKWLIEGPSGGEYVFTIWWHWGDHEDGWDACTGCYPQMRRSGSGDLIGHGYRVAVDGPIHVGPPVERTVETGEVARVIHESNGDRHHAIVVDSQWGDLEVKSLDPPPKQFHDAEYTIDPEDVLGWRAHR